MVKTKAWMLPTKSPSVAVLISKTEAAISGAPARKTKKAVIEKAVQSPSTTG